MSDFYRQFVSSMTIGFDQWHDGEGYDLDALARCDDAEKRQAARLLADKLASGGGWRDVDALETLGYDLGGPPMHQAYLRHADPEIRLRAGLALQNWKAPIPVDVDEMVVEIIRNADDGGLTYMLQMAEANPTPKVRQALLDKVRTGERTARIHCAALLLYLAGEAKEAFDWDHRPFFLRFGEDGPDREKAFQELKKRIGL
jgi:hypothetical protein